MTSKVFAFFHLLLKQPKLSQPFVLITSARFPLESVRTIFRYSVNGTTQSHSCFRSEKQNTFTIWRKINLLIKKVRKVCAVTRYNWGYL